MSLALAALLGYLIGSIPFGVLITRALGLGDLRAIGSGNIGATNVLRTGNKAAAAATLALDGGKGAAAVLVARALLGESAAMVAGFAAFLGHLFTAWLGLALAALVFVRHRANIARLLAGTEPRIGKGG